MASDNLTKFDDYTKDSGIDDQLIAKTSELNNFSYTDSIAVDQQYEDFPYRKVSGADGNTGGDIFGRIETSRDNQTGFYKIVLPVTDPATGVDYVAFAIETSIGGAGGAVTGASFLNLFLLPGAAPGGNQQTIVPGYIYAPDLPTSNQGAGYLWVDGAAANVIKMGT